MNNRPELPIVWALREAARRGYSPTDGYILIVLANHMNGGEAWPSVPALAQRCNCSERHARRALRLFEHDGLIAIARGSGRGNTSTYRLLAPNVRNGQTSFDQDIFPAATHPLKGDSHSPFVLESQKKPDSLRKKRGTQSPPESTKGNPLVQTSSGALVARPVNGANGHPSSDPKEILWGQGRDTLRRLTGQTHSAASKQIGRWLKLANQDATAVFACIADAAREGPHEPVPWITAGIQTRLSPKSTKTDQIRERWNLPSFLAPEIAE